MKNYLIVYSIIIVLIFGTFFLFTDETMEVETVHFTVEHVQSALDEFDLQIKFPNAIPEDMTVKNANITIINGKHQMIGFRYSHCTNSYGFEFYASKLTVDINKMIQNDEYWKWKKTTINGMDTFIGRNGKNIASNETNIMMIDQDILYRFYSKEMKPEELLQIASSLKPH